MGACALALVSSGTLALSVPIALPEGVRDLPHGSLVRTTPEACEEGVVVEVLSVAGWYPAARPTAAGARGCVARQHLASVGDAVFVALADAPLGVAPPLPAGTLLGAVMDPAACDASAYTFTNADPGHGDAHAVPLAGLASLRAVAPAPLAGVERVREAHAALFGPIPLHRVPWTDWGRVGLPLSPLSAEAIAAEWAREGLDTPARRERAVVAEGPATTNGPAYTHFLGADAPGSDTWADPDTVVHLLRLAAAWKAACGEDPACTLSVGDLSWYNPTKPDPLGHRDHTGACVDLRLFRHDGSRYEAWWNRPDDRTGASAYDRARTIAFLGLADATSPVTDVFFNDPAVRAAVPRVRPLAGHDDHVHLCFAQDAADTRAAR